MNLWTEISPFQFSNRPSFSPVSFVLTIHLLYHPACHNLEGSSLNGFFSSILFNSVSFLFHYFSHLSSPSLPVFLSLGTPCLVLFTLPSLQLVFVSPLFYPPSASTSLSLSVSNFQYYLPISFSLFSLPSPSIFVAPIYTPPLFLHPPTSCILFPSASRLPHTSISPLLHFVISEEVPR